jgi:hypothetical protein
MACSRISRSMLRGFCVLLRSKGIGGFGVLRRQCGCLIVPTPDRGASRRRWSCSREAENPSHTLSLRRMVVQATRHRFVRSALPDPRPEGSCPTRAGGSPANSEWTFSSKVVGRVARPTRRQVERPPAAERSHQWQTYLGQQVGRRCLLGAVQIFLECRRIGGFTARLHEPRSI